MSENPHLDAAEEKLLRLLAERAAREPASASEPEKSPLQNFAWDDVVSSSPSRLLSLPSLISPAPPVGDLTIQQRFEDFHNNNPHVYELLVRFARQASEAGRYVGMKALWERMRWELLLTTATDDEFRLNNNYTSRYSRLIMDQEPDLSGFFEVRELRAR